eukprot:1030809-Alexandrium_andersonii.AAC.1
MAARGPGRVQPLPGDHQDGGGGQRRGRGEERPGHAGPRRWQHPAGAELGGVAPRQGPRSAEVLEHA